MKFTSCVWIRDGEQGISPIATVEEAAEFLDTLPGELRGAYAHVAGKSIELARAGDIPPDQAKQHFLDFCEKAGLLAEDRMAT